MPEPTENTSATVPPQPETKPPLKRGLPVVIALVVIVALIGLANLSSLLGGNKRGAPTAVVPMRPATPSAQQVTSFETQQQLQAKHDAEERQHQQELARAVQQLEDAQATPGPESTGASPMTAAQRAAIYGSNPNAPAHTSQASEAQAEAKQRELAKEKRQQDAIDSDTLAVDFGHSSGTTAFSAMAAPAATTTTARDMAASDVGGATSISSAPVPINSDGKDAALAKYDFDTYEGTLFRVFEGTVLEGVVTNHIDGGFSGPILVDLTTDLYSHDHQQLLLPQGTRLLGDVENVSSGQQRKIFVTFHRAICPDGFSLAFAKYIGLDQIGTTGLATKVNHGYLEAFAAAAAIGGLGGLAQIGNNSTVLDPSTQIRNGISGQSAVEAEQILNHFLNRLPVITLKEGSRARVYIGTDLLIPSYDEHRINPTL
jgi:type IV secretion system protein VirB10